MNADPIVKEFRNAVNMTASELQNHLSTDESQKVGYKPHEGDESVGHDSGRKIVKVLHTRQDDLTEADLKHMHKVVGYVHRHLAQRPDGDVSHTNWRTSLMNWGHDPLKQ